MGAILELPSKVFEYSDVMCLQINLFKSCFRGGDTNSL